MRRQSSGPTYDLYKVLLSYTHLLLLDLIPYVFASFSNTTLIV